MSDASGPHKPTTQQCFRCAARFPIRSALPIGCRKCFRDAFYVTPLQTLRSCIYLFLLQHQHHMTTACLRRLFNTEPHHDTSAAAAHVQLDMHILQTQGRLSARSRRDRLYAELPTGAAGVTSQHGQLVSAKYIYIYIYIHDRKGSH